MSRNITVNVYSYSKRERLLRLIFDIVYSLGCALFWINPVKSFKKQHNRSLYVDKLIANR